jgi:hypothetical protein
MGAATIHPMCGRYASFLPAEAMARIFGTVNPLPNLAAALNVAPTQESAVVRRYRETGDRHLDLLTWGLLPYWTRRQAMNVGYARTSTSDQTAGLDAQARDLKAAGAEKIFSEQVSSVAKRVKLAECLAFLREGDVLMVTKPDRLARSTAELLSIEADLTKRGIAW